MYIFVSIYTILSYANDHLSHLKGKKGKPPIRKAQ